MAEGSDMNIYKLMGRNIEVTDAMRQYAEEKISRLSRITDQIVDASIIMSYDSNKHAGSPAKVEVQLNVPGSVIRAEERALDTYAATDLVAEKLERQLQRYKDRVLDQRAPAVPVPTETEPEERDPQITRVKRHVLRPMAPEDAAIQMEDLGHDFFLFRNVDTDLISVIYLRDDGDYGLIEPKE